MIKVLALGRARPLFEVVVRTAAGDRSGFCQRGVCFSPDGRYLAAACRDVVRLWDEAGRPVKVFRGHEASVDGLAFSPDGRRLISASHDGTAVVWDVNWIGPAPVPPPPSRVGERLWQALAEDNAEGAADAMLTLRENPAEAVALLAARLVPAGLLGQKQVQALITRLDSDSAAQRRQAAADLHRLDQQAEKALRGALAASPSAEVRKAASRLLDRLEDGTLHPDRLREVRAVEVLENIGTPVAKSLLRKLAAGADSRLTREAEAALKRLARRAGAALR